MADDGSDQQPVSNDEGVREAVWAIDWIANMLRLRLEKHGDRDGLVDTRINAYHARQLLAALTCPNDAPRIEEEARQTIRDALLDSQYLAGITAGWNAAQADDPEAALAALRRSRSGHLAGFAEAKKTIAAIRATQAKVLA